MNLEQIQENAIKIYNNNLEFLLKNNKDLYEKIKLFGLGLELEQITPIYELEYTDEGYFDIKYINKNTYIYGGDSLEYSDKLSSKANFYSKENGFKTSFDLKYKSDDLEDFLENPITINRLSGIAPIISYVDDNLPIKEEMKVIYSYIFFGTGLGFHIPKIHKKIKSRVYHIIEPSLEIFRLSLFTTDYSLLSTSVVHFHVSVEESDFRRNITIGIESISLLNHYIKYCIFSNDYIYYINIIRETLVARVHLLFSFERRLLYLDRTHKYIQEGYKFLEKNNHLNPIQDTPVLLLAAGPSLHKNLEFIKRNKKKYIIFAALVLMPFLEDNNIVPDFIVQVDGDEEIFSGILNKVNNISFFNTTKYLFISNIAPNILERFKKENVYLFQALFTITDEYLNAVGTSVGEMMYFLILKFGFKKIYLLGLDLALGLDREMHSSAHPLSEDTNKRVLDEEGMTLSKSILEVKGNFREKVETLILFKTSIDSFNFINSKDKKSDVLVYNLSDGAYLNDTIPYDINKINNLKDINKEDELSLLINTLDKTIINHKLSHEFKNIKVKEYLKLKEQIEEVHLKRKYKNAEEFSSAIISLINIVTKSSKENDILVNILLNYYKFTLEYIVYFFNLKRVENQKRHIKKLNKYLYIQTDKIFTEYLRIIEENIK